MRRRRSVNARWYAADMPWFSSNDSSRTWSWPGSHVSISARVRSVDRSGSPVLHHPGSDQRAHGLGDLANAHRDGALDVERLVDRGVLESLDVRLREVLDVDEEPLLAAITVDAQCLGPHAPLHECG